MCGAAIITPIHINGALRYYSADMRSLITRERRGDVQRKSPRHWAKEVFMCPDAAGKLAIMRECPPEWRELVKTHLRLFIDFKERRANARGR